MASPESLMLLAIHSATWKPKDYVAATKDLPKPLNSLPYFQGADNIKALDKQLLTLRYRGRDRVAPKPPSAHHSTPPEGFATDAPIPGSGKPAAIFDGAHWRIGIYIDTLPMRRQKGTGAELPARRLVVVVVPPTVTAKKTASKAKTAGKKQQSKAAAPKTAVNAQLKLVVCDVSNSFAPAKKK
jgi:hypothetical protein